MRFPSAFSVALVVAMASTVMDRCRADQPFAAENRDCMLRVNDLCEELFAGNVAEGNKGYANLESLFFLLEARASRHSYIDFEHSSHTRAIAWGRCHICPAKGMETLVRCIDVRCRDAVPRDSGDFLGACTASVPLRENGTDSLRMIATVLEEAPENQVSEDQINLLALVCVELLKYDPATVKAYFMRLNRPEGAASRNVGRLAKRAGALVRAEIDIDARPTAEVNRPGGARAEVRGARQYAREEGPLVNFLPDPTIEKLASEIFHSSNIGPLGELGLLDDVGRLVKNRLRAHVDAYPLPAGGVRVQAESVKRSLLFLASMRDPWALTYLARFIDDRLVLYDPRQGGTFRDVEVKGLIRAYGEGVLPALVEQATATPNGQGDSGNLERCADLLISAFGSRPADVGFLVAFVRRTQHRSDPAVPRLIALLKSKEKQGGNCGD
jgi:hypothetical protein